MENRTAAIIIFSLKTSLLSSLLTLGIKGKALGINREQEEVEFRLPGQSRFLEIQTENKK